MPAKLTKAYIEGQRVSYYNPTRIFIISLFTFFTLFVLQVSTGLDQLDSMTEQQRKKTWKAGLEADFDTLSLENNFGVEQTKLIKEKLFDKVFLDSTLHTNHEQDDDNGGGVEEDIDEEDDKKSLSVNWSSQDNEGDTIEDVSFELEDLFKLQKDSSDYKLTQRDFIVLTEEEFKEKIASDNKLKDAALVQSYKLFNNPSASIQFILGNGTWAILVLILLMALLYKVLYFRSNFLYVEHFLFHLCGHTRILLLLIFSLLLHKFIDLSLTWANLIIPIGIIYLFLGMRRFYLQSRFKTFVKMCFTLLFYIGAILFCNILILGISFLVF